MNKHVIDQSLKPAPRANALSIFTCGNSLACDDESVKHRRALFCNHVVHFADLDAYPRRAKFIAAYSAGGSEDARRLEAMYLAESGLLSAREIAQCAAWAEADYSPWAVRGLTPEIV